MDVRDYLTRIRSDADAALALLGPAAPVETIVRAGDNLQAALDKGGALRLDAGAVFSGNFIARKNGTRLAGSAGSELRGSALGPALWVPPGTQDIQLSSFKATTAWDQSVIMLGSNDATQASPSAAPAGIILTEVLVPKHRGKRAFEINATKVALVNCGCSDVFDPAGRDSQGIAIANTPGDVHVTGGTYEAGSENILIGGFGGTQAAKIVPDLLLFEALTLSRPDSWRSDGVKRVVKTLFEVKNGHNVTLRNSMLYGCWTDGQSGYGMTVTPRDGGSIQNVLIEDVQERNVGGGLNLLAQDDGAYSERVSGVVLRRVVCLAQGQPFGPGRFVQLGGEVLGFNLDDCEFSGPDSIVTSYAAKTWDSPTSSRQSFVTKGAVLRGNSFVSGAYGLMLTGAQGAGAFGKFWKEAWPDGIISGNTFGGASGLSHKPNLPADNSFVVA